VFPIFSRVSVACVCLALLAGCQNFSEITPGAQSSELVQRFGKPNAVWRNSDGSQVWEYPGDYPRVANGREKFLIEIGTDQTVRTVRQVLTEEYLSKVRVGMSHDDVRKILGTPHEIAIFDRVGEEVWTWPYREPPNDMLFHVYFDRTSGTVKQVLRLDNMFVPSLK
jgi:SmpA / OmlA family